MQLCKNKVWGSNLEFSKNSLLKSIAKCEKMNNEFTKLKLLALLVYTRW
jgi:hypothetical protein